MLAKTWDAGKTAMVGQASILVVGRGWCSPAAQAVMMWATGKGSQCKKEGARLPACLKRTRAVSRAADGAIFFFGCARAPMGTHTDSNVREASQPDLGQTKIHEKQQ